MGNGVKRFLAVLAFLLAVSTLASNASGEERRNVCAKYATQDGWSEPYHVHATIADGSELNMRTNTFDFQMGTAYIVIFWQQHEASIISMQSPFFTGIGYEPGVDREGRQWQLSNDNGFCY